MLATFIKACLHCEFRDIILLYSVIMVKVLLCGDINNKWADVITRVNALQKSAHGPFDCLVCIGNSIQNEDTYNDIVTNYTFPIPFYILNEQDLFKTNESKNLFIMEPNVLFNIGLLTCVYHTSTISKDALQSVQSITSSNPSYRGCDFLFSNEWPKDVHQFLSDTDYATRSNIADSIPIGVGTTEVSDFATIVRPRYHICSGYDAFYQRPPFKFETKKEISTCCRFISLAGVNDTKDKTRKWMHALSLAPITHMSSSEINELDSSVIANVDCPYVKVGGSAVVKRSGGVGVGGDMKRTKIEDTTISAGVLATTATSFFFNDPSSGRGKPTGVSRDMVGKDSNGRIISSAPKDLPVNPNCTTLFIGNISSSGECSDEDICQSMFPNECIRGSSKYMNNIVNGTASASSASEWTRFIQKISRIPGKSFVFVECYSHEAALDIVNRAKNTVFFMVSDNERHNRHITVGWGNNSSNSDRKGGISSNGAERDKKYSFLLNTTRPSSDSKTLFVSNLPTVATGVDLENTLSKLFNNVPIGNIKHPHGRNFAFIEFESGEEAGAVMSVALQLKEDLLQLEEIQSQPLSRSNVEEDMTTVPEIMEKYKYRIDGQVLAIGWAKGKPADKVQKLDTHTQDCWFCLSSPDVKVHLLMAISDHSYVALARGGVVDMHVLIIPIDCVPNRLHLSAECKSDMLEFDKRLTKMFHSLRLTEARKNRPPLPPGAPPVTQSPPLTPSFPSDSFVCLKFERAMRTKGKDHMQYQILPIPSHFFLQDQHKTNPNWTIDIFQQVIKKYSLEFIEMSTTDEDNAHSVEDYVLTKIEGGPYQEYFYIEIPVVVDNMIGFKRYVYVDRTDTEGSSSQRKKQFPMFLGNEIGSLIINDPHRSNWKNCLLTEEHEMNIVNYLKEHFVPYDFTGN